MFLELEGIRKSYGEKDYHFEVLRGIPSLSVEKGEFVVLLGPSGSGKSTLLNIIGGIDHPDEGKITVDGKVLKDMNAAEMTRYRRQHLGYIFQMYPWIPNLTVRRISRPVLFGKDPLNIDELIEVLGLAESRE